MRILIVPEVYRDGDLSTNGTVNDAAVWIREWLRRDETVHVYLLLPPAGDDGYGPVDDLAARDRVTILEAPTVALAFERHELFSENGYTSAQLHAIERAIFDQNAYVDVVIDQLRTGRSTLYKWLLDHTDHWTAKVRPFDVVANVHDLQVPRKYRFSSFRNDYQMRMEVCAAAFADGIWVTAGVDAERMYEQARAFFHPDIVEEVRSRTVVTSSPIDVSRYEETYADEPRWLHVAGSQWNKKCVDRVVAVAERLNDRFGIRTVMTSMETIPADYAERAWVTAHSEADRATYEATLRRGDLAICASEYETMARTPFEQAASGQVLVIRDRPWIYDSVPGDYRLTGDLDALGDLAVWAVEHWDEAVAANRELVAHVESVRNPAYCGRRTYRDLRERVASKVEQYDRRDVAPVERVADGREELSLGDLRERLTAAVDGGALAAGREEYAVADVVNALRALGYEDAGNPGTPVFVRRG